MRYSRCSAGAADIEDSNFEPCTPAYVPLALDNPLCEMQRQKGLPIAWCTRRRELEPTALFQGMSSV